MPLARVTLDAMAAHLAAFPAVEVDVEDRVDPRTDRHRRRAAQLVFTLDDGRRYAATAGRSYGRRPRGLLAYQSARACM